VQNHLRLSVAVIWLFSSFVAGLVLVYALVRRRSSQTLVMPVPPSTSQIEAEQPSKSVMLPVNETSRELHVAERLLVVVGAVIAFALSLVLAYQWLHLDPGLLAFSANIAQLLALLSLIGLQTHWGQEIARGVNVRWWPNKRQVLRILWLFVALLALLFFIGSPLAASVFNQQGVDALETGQYDIAVYYLRRAASLMPDSARTHYNLGNAYESLSQFDQAIAEYQIALEKDYQLGAAYNNLGRLFLHARHESDSALSILQIGLGQVTDPLSKTILKKNIGEAYLARGLHRTSLAALNEVANELMELNNQGAPVTIYLAETYRLMALGYEAVNQPDQASRAWSSSLGYALAIQDSEVCTRPIGQSLMDCPNSRTWAAEAQEHLNATER
jgi:tetratricopeptide (TPR) repeat protein